MASSSSSERPLVPVALMLTSLLVFVGMLAANGLSTLEVGILQQTETTDTYSLEITPTGATFSIWAVIYLWQVLFMLYSLSTLCRRGAGGGRLYHAPGHNPPALFALYIFNNVANIGWLVAFSLKWLVASSVLILLIPVSLVIMLVISHVYLYRTREELRLAGLGREVWLTVFLVQNALAMYATWTIVATLLNFTFMAVYVGGTDQTMSSTWALVALGVIALGWVTADTFFLYRYTNWLFSPHVTLVWALSGVVAATWSPAWPINSVIAVALLTFACLALATKLVLMFWRHFRDTSVMKPTTA